jgi:eukaryotic-like serine/threonine-protein kinase
MATISADELSLLRDGPVASVYVSRHAGVPVALKVFPRKFDKRTTAAFEREQAALAGPSILSVDAVDEVAGGRHALRMELCPQSLAGLVERVGPLTPADVVMLGRAMGLALATAHRAGVVHGGVSPSNVLFRESGEPVVADFGVTLRHAFARDPLHTIGYLAPETLRTGTLSERTDLYGVGAVLHFALTGRSPHLGRLGEQPGDQVLRILSEAAPMINRPDVPIELSTLIARLLAPEPQHRPPDAAAVADHLAGLLLQPRSVSTVEDFGDLAASSPGEAGAGDSDDLDHDDAGTPDRVSPMPAAASLGPPHTPRHRIRYGLIAGGAILLGLLAVLSVLQLHDDPGELTTTPRLPVISGSDAIAVQLELAEPTDRGDHVELTWHSARTLDFAVVVAREGEPTRVLLAQRNRAMTVPVDPGRKYCFLIQATDGNQVYESQPKPLRGAVCRT